MSRYLPELVFGSYFLFSLWVFSDVPATGRLAQGWRAHALGFWWLACIGLFTAGMTMLLPLRGHDDRILIEALACLLMTFGVVSRLARSKAAETWASEEKRLRTRVAFLEDEIAAQKDKRQNETFSSSR